MTNVSTVQWITHLVGCHGGDKFARVWCDDGRFAASTGVTTNVCVHSRVWSKRMWAEKRTRSGNDWRCNVLRGRENGVWDYSTTRESRGCDLRERERRVRQTDQKLFGRFFFQLADERVSARVRAVEAGVGARVRGVRENEW